MDNFIKLLQTIIIIIILGLLLWFIFFKAPKREQELRQYWEAKDFKTDTVHVDVDYTKLPRPEYKNYVPPAVVVEYKAPAINNQISVNLDDSLIQVIDSLQNTITNIHQAYLQLYPQASKLIYGNFSQDTLKLDVLLTSGRIQSQVYPVDYARFRYQYINNEFQAHRYETRTHKESLHGVLYGYAGYGFARNWSPLIGLDYSLYKGRLRAGVNGLITLHQDPQPIFMGTIGYRLYGN